MENSTANFAGFDSTTDASQNGDVDLEVNSIQGAYTMGGMTLALSLDDIENASYTTSKDQKEMLFTVAMSF